MRCDVVADGILSSISEGKTHPPIVVRLQGKRALHTVLGTNIKEAQEKLKRAGARILLCDDLDEAAKKAAVSAKLVAMAKEAGAEVTFSARGA